MPTPEAVLMPPRPDTPSLDNWHNTQFEEGSTRWNMAGNADISHKCSRWREAYLVMDNAPQSKPSVESQSERDAFLLRTCCCRCNANTRDDDKIHAEIAKFGESEFRVVCIECVEAPTGAAREGAGVDDGAGHAVVGGLQCDQRHRLAVNGASKVSRLPSQRARQGVMRSPLAAKAILRVSKKNSRDGHVKDKVCHRCRKN